jgi:hypothetical protein
MSLVLTRKLSILVVSTESFLFRLSQEISTLSEATYSLRGFDVDRGAFRASHQRVPMCSVSRSSANPRWFNLLICFGFVHPSGSFDSRNVDCREPSRGSEAIMRRHVCHASAVPKGLKPFSSLIGRTRLFVADLQIPDQGDNGQYRKREEQNEEKTLIKERDRLLTVHTTANLGGR